MTDKEKELVNKYLDFKKVEREAKTNASNVLKELSLLAPRHVGEIIKWTETKRFRVGGTSYNPIYKNLPPVEKKAVLSSVKAIIWDFINGAVSLRYDYVFSPIKKDGTISQQTCNPPSHFEWTGETYKED